MARTPPGDRSIIKQVCVVKEKAKVPVTKISPNVQTEWDFFSSHNSPEMSGPDCWGRSAF